MKSIFVSLFTVISLHKMPFILLNTFKNRLFPKNPSIEVFPLFKKKLQAPARSPVYSWARIFKLLTRPWIVNRLIDSKEPIPRVCAAWQASTTTLFLVGSYGPQRLFKNSSTVWSNVTKKLRYRWVFSLPVTQYGKDSLWHNCNMQSQCKNR
jgi:hypothetical protein